jgi:hypothetical protein
MVRVRRVCASALLAGVCCLLGCDKEVDLTFVNLTSDSLGVAVAVPREGRQHLGIVLPHGGKLRHELEFDKDDLPVTCWYMVGQQQGQFTVTRKSPKELWIDIRPLGAPRVRDKHTTVNEEVQVDIKPLPVRQEEVVE